MRISDWSSDVCSSDLFPGGYELRYDGVTSQWTLARTDGSASVSGNGSLDLDGIHLDLGGAPAGGDWYALQGQTGAAGMRVLLADCGKIAADVPFSASTGTANQGGVTVSVGPKDSAALFPPPAPTSFLIPDVGGGQF